MAGQRRATPGYRKRDWAGDKERCLPVSPSEGTLNSFERTRSSSLGGGSVPESCGLQGGKVFRRKGTPSGRRLFLCPWINQKGSMRKRKKAKKKLWGAYKEY